MPFDTAATPFGVLFLDCIEDSPFWILCIELRGWVIGSVIGTSGSIDSITSTFDVTVTAALHDDKWLDDRVVWDSRVRFRLGDECSEDVDVDVIKSAIAYQSFDSLIAYNL